MSSAGSMLRLEVRGQGHSKLARTRLAVVRPRGVARTLTKSVFCVLGSGLAVASACGTDAVGVSECREIEQARCVAAEACGYADAAGCQRFFRDHCLHGLALPEVDASDVEDCVSVIEAAGRCAGSQGGETAPTSCAEPALATASAEAVCDVVRQPELAPRCAFLRPANAPEPPANSDAGGGS